MAYYASIPVRTSAAMHFFLSALTTVDGCMTHQDFAHRFATNQDQVITSQADFQRNDQQTDIRQRSQGLPHLKS